MDLRKSFLKPFKKLKDKLPGGHRKRDGRSGSGNNREGEEVDIEGSEASRTNSFLHSEVDVGSAVESGPSREGNNASRKEVVSVDDLPITTLFVSQGGKSNGM